MSTRTPLGIIGCGTILPAYVNGLARFGNRVELVRCADVDLPRAVAAASQYGIPRAGSVEALLADEAVVVVNLTPPAVHAEVSQAALAAVLTFTSGAIGTLVASFDSWDHQLPAIELYGTEGTLAVPHPNWFDGQVRLKRHDDPEWRMVPGVIPSLQGEGREGQMLRGLGVLDLIDSLAGGPHRTNASIAFHTLEVLEAIQAASDTAQVVTLTSSCDRPSILQAHELARWTD